MAIGPSLGLPTKAISRLFPETDTRRPNAPTGGCSELKSLTLAISSERRVSHPRAERARHAPRDPVSSSENTSSSFRSRFNSAEVCGKRRLVEVAIWVTVARPSDNRSRIRRRTPLLMRFTGNGIGPFSPSSESESSTNRIQPLTLSEAFSGLSSR